MNEAINTQQVLTIVGMHRSGTSMATNFFESCGLYIGDNLIEARGGNPKGHFEDRDILQAHENILMSSDLDYLVQPNDSIQITKHHIEQIRELVNAHKQQAQWGWKDPRTTLFLNLWKTQILPDLKIIALFRHPALVAESLRKRDQNSKWLREQTRRLYRPFHKIRYSMFNIRRMRQYYGAWQRYNEAILDFYEQYPDDCLIVNTDEFPILASSIIQFANTRWGFSFQQENIDTVYDENLITTKLPVTAKIHYQLYGASCGGCYDVLNNKYQESKIRLTQIQETVDE